MTAPAETVHIGEDDLIASEQAGLFGRRALYNAGNHTAASTRSPRNSWLVAARLPLSVTVVVLVPLEKRFDVLRRDQTHVVAQSGQLAADVMGTRSAP